MSYGADLINQWEQLELLAAKNVATLDRYSEFLRERAKVDSDYAKAMSKLCKTYRDENAKHGKTPQKVVDAAQASAVERGYVDLITASEEVANHHQTLSDEFGKDIRNQVKNQIKELERVYKAQFDKIRFEIANYKKAVDAIERAKAKYEKAVKDMDSTRKAYEAANQDMNATKKDIEKLRTQAERMATASYEAEGQYKKLIEETNTLKNKHFGETLPDLLNEFQSFDGKDRVEFTRAVYAKYTESIAAFQPIVSTVVERLTQANNHVSAETEQQTIIATFKGGDEASPVDFVFEERQLQTEPTAKASTRGFTKQASNDDNKEDAIIATPPSKQGRKKAADRLKVLDKELSEVEKKLQSLANFISIYQAKPDLNADINVRRDLDDQHRALTTRIAQINKRRYKLQVYIATIDGTQPPAPPAGVDATTSPLSAAPSPLEPVPDTSRNNVKGSSTADVSSINVAQSNAAISVAAAVVDEQQPISASNSKIAVDAPASVHKTSAVEIATQASAVNVSKPPTHKPQNDESGEDDLEQDLVAEPIAKAKVLYDFEATANSEELSVKAGQEIDVLEKQDDGWWKARVNEARIVGYLPGTYVQEV